MTMPNDKSSKFCLPQGCCINIVFVMDFDIREVEWPNFLLEVAFVVVDLRMIVRQFGGMKVALF